VFGGGVSDATLAAGGQGMDAEAGAEAWQEEGAGGAGGEAGGRGGLPGAQAGALRRQAVPDLGGGGKPLDRGAKGLVEDSTGNRCSDRGLSVEGEKHATHVRLRPGEGSCTPNWGTMGDREDRGIPVGLDPACLAAAVTRPC